MKGKLTDRDQKSKMLSNGLNKVTTAASIILEVP